MNESNRRERERLEGVEAGAAELYRQRKQAEQGRKSRTEEEEEEEEGDKSAVSPSVTWLAGWPLMMPSSILPWLLLLILVTASPAHTCC
jgi:hypothetical protein